MKLHYQIMPPWQDPRDQVPTRKGLKVSCQLDLNTYEKGLKVSDKDLNAVQLRKDAFHPEWNYTLLAS